MSNRGVSISEFCEKYPVLYHMAEKGSWPSIKRNGLLSTSALLDLFGVGENARYKLESERRPSSVEISSSLHGKAIIRDQKPMDDAGLLRCLQDGLTPEQWYKTLNSKVFFWVTLKRLNTLLGSRAYRQLEHDVLLLRTASVLDANKGRVLLSGMNSGATRPFAWPRGRETFLSLKEFPWEERRSKADQVVEFVVERGVMDVCDHALEVYRVKHGEEWQRIWTSK